MDGNNYEYHTKPELLEQVKRAMRSASSDPLMKPTSFAVYGDEPRNREGKG